MNDQLNWDWEDEDQDWYYEEDDDDETAWTMGDVTVEYKDSAKVLAAASVAAVTFASVLF